MKIKLRSLQYFTLFIYLCSLSAFQRDTVFESTLEVASFVFFVGTTLLQYLSGGQRKLKIDRMAIWYGVFIVFSVLSSMWAVYSRSEVFFYIKKMIQIVVVVECLSLIIMDKRDIETIFKIILASLVFAGLLLISRIPFSEWGTKRVGPEIGLDENILGARMSIGFILSLYFLMKKSGKIYLLMMIMLGILTVFSGSKKAIIMTIAGWFFLYLYGKMTKDVLCYISRLIVVVLALAAAFYVIFRIPVFYNVLGIRLERTITYFLSGKRTFDHSTSERLYYMTVAKQLFKEHPLLGIGLNNFKIYISTVYIHAAYSHNNYWELLSCLGIIGTVIFYSFHFRLFFKLTTMFRSAKNDSMQVLMLVVLVIFLAQDYASVTFMNVFQYVLICLIYNFEKINYKRM